MHTDVKSRIAYSLQYAWCKKMRLRITDESLSPPELQHIEIYLQAFDSLQSRYWAMHIHSIPCRIQASDDDNAYAHCEHLPDQLTSRPDLQGSLVTYHLDLVEQAGF